MELLWPGTGSVPELGSGEALLEGMTLESGTKKGRNRSGYET